MAICQVKRNQDGDIEEVLAGNGKKSLAYTYLLDKVNEMKDVSALQDKFKPWEGKHIYTVTKKPDLALALYKQIYSEGFKNKFGDWENGKFKPSDINGEPSGKALDYLLGSQDNIEKKASPATLKKISEFLSRIGVTTSIFDDIRDEKGQKLGVNGIADPLAGLIKVTQGKVDAALPEEAMHMAVALIENKNPLLFKEMMNQIGNYQLFTQTVQDYKDLKEYQIDGKPNIPKLKKEAIGKVLAETIINQNEGINEKPELDDRARSWWQKIIDFLKGLFIKAKMDPLRNYLKIFLKGKKN